MNNRRLSVRGLRAAYDGVTVFTDVSFDVAAGELVSIMGSSGAGKSTLLRILCGLMDAADGDVYIDEEHVIAKGTQTTPVENRRIGLMFQDFALFPHMTVHENVGFGIRDQVDRDERVRSLLRAVDLEGFGERDVRSLSGGQQQRVALIRALAPKPALLLLDEPLANLDSENRRPIALLLKQMIEREGTAAIMVTHDRSEAMGLSQRVGILETFDDAVARLSQIDTPERLFWSPVTAGVARLTGDCIICECFANGTSGDTIFGRVRLNTEHFGDIRVMIRPQTLRWSTTFSGSFRVLSAYFEGPGYHLEIESVNGVRFTLNDVLDPPAVGTDLNIETTRDVVAFTQSPHEA